MSQKVYIYNLHRFSQRSAYVSCLPKCDQFFFVARSKDMPYRRSYRRRPTRRRAPYRRRPRRRKAAGTIQKFVRRIYKRRKARQIVRKARAYRFTRRMNNPYTQKKMMTFARLLPASMCTPTGFWTFQGTQNGVIQSDGNTGQLEGGFQAGLGFYDGNIPISSVSPINSNLKAQLPLWRQCRCTSVKYTFVPFGLHSADEAGVNNTTVPGTPCAPQATYSAGEKTFKNLFFFSHVDAGRYLDAQTLLAQVQPLPEGIAGSKISLGSETNSITDKGTYLRRISSRDIKPFSITVRSAPKNSELWNWKKNITDNQLIPSDQLRGGSSALVDCADVLTWMNGGWTGPMAPNNQAMYAATMTPVLSYKCIGFPSLLDAGGRAHGYPVFKVTVQARVLFVGKKSLASGGTPNP